MKFNKICKHPYCRELTSVGAYCDKHRPPAVQHSNPYRKLYGRRWQRESRRFLIKNIYCVMCSDSATETDHIIPHRGDADLFWDKSNWQPLCESCHSAKTNAEIKARKCGCLEP